MALTFGLFASASGDTRSYTQADLAKLFRLFARSGVKYGHGGDFGVTAGPGMAVTVATGMGFVDGYWVENDASITLGVANGGATTRYDRVVLQLDENGDREIEVLVVSGEGYEPSAPPLIRAGGIYQLGLATVQVIAGETVQISTVIDTRMEPTQCGYIEPRRVTQTSFFPTGAVDMQGQRLTNLPYVPTGATDATSKYYVDYSASQLNNPNVFPGDTIFLSGDPNMLEDYGPDHSNPATGAHIFGRRIGTTGRAIWLLCNGAEVRKNDDHEGAEDRDQGFPNLFTALRRGSDDRTWYGAATGGTLFFKLPDARGRLLGVYKQGDPVYIEPGTTGPAKPIGTGANEVPPWGLIGGMLVRAWS